MRFSIYNVITEINGKNININTHKIFTHEHILIYDLHHNLDLILLYGSPAFLSAQKN